MKCSSMKLVSRKDHKKNISQNNQENNQNNDNNKFVTREFHSYSFAFIRKNKSNEIQKEPNLSVTNIILPETFQSFNTGSSLDKWSQKRPRLKSANHKNNNTKNYIEEIDEYDELSIDVNNILKELDEGYEDNNEDDISTSNLEYEVHSDIEELLLKSQRFSEEESVKLKSKKRRKKSCDKKIKSDNNEKSAQKKKSKKKTIKFSLSKPQSPETEQIIRVDVTSNVSIEELDRLEISKSEESMTADCSKGHTKMINENRREMERSFNESDAIHTEEEDFIIRCRQLAIRQKRR